MHTTSATHADFSRKIKAACLASAGVLSLCAAPALAQTTAVGSASAAQPAPQQQSAVDDIVVTARRDAENAQHVPVSVQVVTGDSLKKLAITTVEEVSKLAPGLTLVNAGSSTSVTLRGVTWQPGSGTPATPIYLNEAPFDPGNTIVSLFDVGQIEVLRGPQGTTRGAPSISGAVTITLHKPDLSEFGGYLQGQYGEGKHSDFQGALNIPVIKDMLAVRFAANIEDSQANRVFSVNSGIAPSFRDRTYRASVLFQPTDTISIAAMYQQRKTLTQEYTAVAGTGSTGYAGIPGFLPAIPKNYNGPALTTADRKSVQDLPSYRPQHIDLLTVNANWEVKGHNLSVNYGRQFNYSQPVLNATDTLNVLPGFQTFTSPSFASVPLFETKEIRLSSIPDGNRPFDYDIGWFSKYSNGVTLFALPTYVPGAFGAPFTYAGGAVPALNPAYVVNTTLASTIQQNFNSFHGNVRFHIDSNTELSGGLAIIRDRVTTITNINSSSALVAFSRSLPAAGGGCPSPFLPPSPFALPNSTTYGPGYCQVTVAASGSTQPDSTRYSDALYNFSLSHSFSDSVLVYATTGSSFRSGLASIGNAGLPSNLVVPKPETAKSYEIGVKTTFGRRLRINVSAFQLDYKNQLTSLIGVRYYNVNLPATSAIVSSNVSFYGNLDARVRGVEAEIAARPFRDLSLGANLSYSQIKSQGGTIPCNSATPLTTTNTINFCAAPKGQTLNTEAPFQATINGGYETQVTDSIGGYLRFNVNYRGKNPNFGNFRSAVDGSFRQVNPYAIVDLFAGVTGNLSNNGWELGVYAKNALDKNVEITRNAPASPFALISGLAPSGYNEVRLNLPREVGVQLRVAFGSR